MEDICLLPGESMFSSAAGVMFVAPHKQVASSRVARPRVQRGTHVTFPPGLGRSQKGRTMWKVSDVLQGRCDTHTESRKQQAQCVFEACVTSHDVKTFNVSLEFASIIENWMIRYGQMPEVLAQQVT